MENRKPKVIAIFGYDYEARPTYAGGKKLRPQDEIKAHNHYSQKYCEENQESQTTQWTLENHYSTVDVFPLSVKWSEEAVSLVEALIKEYDNGDKYFSLHREYFKKNGTYLIDLFDVEVKRKLNEA